MFAHLLIAFFKAERFFVTCPFKWITGLDCPGCGFQRSLWALIQGHFMQSFDIYPPTLFFLLSFSAAASAHFFKWKSDSKLLKVLYFATGVVVVINYIFKLCMHQL
jgi:hypothetical protein